MQFVKNVLVYVFGVFTFSFCYCFYEDFIHKTILVSQSLPFICISCPLKVFKLNTEILRDSCAVPLLKTLSRLPQSIAFLCLILFLVFAYKNFPFRAFVTMIYWTSTVVLPNLVAPLDSAVPSLDFEQINVFWTSGLILLVLYLIHSVLEKHPWNVFLAFDLGVPSSDIDKIMALIPLTLHSFSQWFAQFQQKAV